MRYESDNYLAHGLGHKYILKIKRPGYTRYVYDPDTVAGNSIPKHTNDPPAPKAYTSTPSRPKTSQDNVDELSYHKEHTRNLPTYVSPGPTGNPRVLATGTPENFARARRQHAREVGDRLRAEATAAASARQREAAREAAREEMRARASAAIRSREETAERQRRAREDAEERQMRRNTAHEDNVRRREEAEANTLRGRGKAMVDSLIRKAKNIRRKVGRTVRPKLRQMGFNVGRRKKE